MMTSFGIRVKFSDSEMDLLQKSLDHYLNVWRREFRKGNGAAYSVSIKRFRMTSKAELKYGRGVSMDEGQIAAVQRVLQTYLEACQIPGGPGVTVRERRMIKKISAILERELRRVVINSSLRSAARGMLWD
jgi:hypothetical protein